MYCLAILDLVYFNLFLLCSIYLHGNFLVSVFAQGNSRGKRESIPIGQEMPRQPRDTSANCPICVFICEICLTVFYNFDSYTEHKKSYSKVTPSQSFCEKDFTQEECVSNTNVVQVKVENIVTLAEHAYAFTGTQQSSLQAQVGNNQEQNGMTETGGYSIICTPEASFPVSNVVVFTQGVENLQKVEMPCDTPNMGKWEVEGLDFANDDDVDNYSSDEDNDSADIQPASDIELLMKTTKDNVKKKRKDAEAGPSKKKQKTLEISSVYSLLEDVGTDQENTDKSINARKKANSSLQEISQNKTVI